MISGSKVISIKEESKKRFVSRRSQGYWHYQEMHPEPSPPVTE